MKSLCIGEVLFDVVGEQEYLGGAPLNCAAHLCKLGARSAILTAVGDDARGQAALSMISDTGVATGFIQVLPDAATGIANVKMSKEGIPKFTLPKDMAYDRVLCDADVLREIRRFAPDIVYFGTLSAYRSPVVRQNIKDILSAVRPELVFYDVNLRMRYYDRSLVLEFFSYADILKLNSNELAVLSKLISYPSDEREFAEKIIREHQVKIICITKGGSGSTVHTRVGGKTFPVPEITVKDTIGAGDAFSAMFLYSYFCTKNPYFSTECGNKLGAYVASKNGAIPEYDKSIKAIIDDIF